MLFDVRQEGHLPLHHALSAVEPSVDSTYPVIFSKHVCAGSVVFGGFVMAYVERCMQHFVSKNDRTEGHQHVGSEQVNFFRPLFPTPQTAVVQVQLENAGRSWSTFHFTIYQDGKKCSAGSMTLTDLEKVGLITLPTPWKLSPPPAGPPPSLDALEKDEQPGWIAFSTPYTPGGYRAYHSYVHFIVPEQGPQSHTVDQWVRPAWVDDSLPNGAVWTNELIHFLLDGSISILDNLLPKAEASGNYDFVLANAQAQRKARKEGRKDWIWSSSDSSSFTTSRIYTSLAFQPEIKKRLPKEGVKWLFLRGQTKAVQDDRMDQESIVLNEHGDLIAMSHQILQIISIKGKSKQNKL